LRAKPFEEKINGFLGNEKKEGVLGFQRPYFQRYGALSGFQFPCDPFEMDLEMTVQGDFFDPYGIIEIFLGGAVRQSFNKIPFPPGKTRKRPENESKNCQKNGE